MSNVLASAAWAGGFVAADLVADRYGLSVSKLNRAFRSEIGPLAYDLLLAGAALGYRHHIVHGGMRRAHL
jgi:hypothetical protein